MPIEYIKEKKLFNIQSPNINESFTVYNLISFLLNNSQPKVNSFEKFLCVINNDELVILESEFTNDNVSMTYLYADFTKYMDEKIKSGEKIDNIMTNFECELSLRLLNQFKTKTDSNTLRYILYINGRLNTLLMERLKYFNDHLLSNNENIIKMSSIIDILEKKLEAFKINQEKQSSNVDTIINYINDMSIQQETSHNVFGFKDSGTDDDDDDENEIHE